MQTIGGVISLPLAPYLADKLGRRPPILLGSFVIITGAGIQGGAQNFGMFLAGRFFIGLGGGLVATAAAPLLGELAYPTHRPIITAIYNTQWVSPSISTTPSPRISTQYMGCSHVKTVRRCHCRRLGNIWYL